MDGVPERSLSAKCCLIDHEADDEKTNVITVRLMRGQSERTY